MKLALPVWFAAMVQTPAASKTALVPDTVQIAGDSDVNVTGRPDVAVAINGIGVGEIPCGTGAVKLMVCDKGAEEAPLRKMKLAEMGTSVMKASVGWLAAATDEMGSRLIV